MQRRFAPHVVLGSCLAVLGVAGLGGVPQNASQSQTSSGPSTGTGLILGRVVDAGSGKPIPGAIVNLAVAPPVTPGSVNGSAGTVQNARAGVVLVAGPRSGAAQTSVVADADGEFAFRDLPAGTCRFNVNARGYSGGGYNQSQPDSTPQGLDLVDGQRVNDLTLKMWKDAVITGRVTDEAGEPVVGVFVRVLRRVVAGGQATFRMSGGGNDTDDRGIYRSAGLPPGDYVVELPVSRTTMPIATFDALQAMEKSDPAAAASMRDYLSGEARVGDDAETGRQIGNLLLSGGNAQGPQGAALAAVQAGGSRLATYPSIFYPSATISTRATVLTLAAGDEKTGIDIALALVPAFRVSGVLTDMDGRPAANVGVRLASLDDQANLDSAPDAVATTISAPNGEFTMLAVPVGQYQLTAVRRAPTGRGLATDAPPPNLGPPGWAKMQVAVSDSDVAGLALGLKSGLSVTGRVVFEGQSPQPTGPQLTRGIRLDAGGQNGAVGSIIAQINADGTFSMAGAMPGRYTLTPAGWPVLQWKAKSVIADGRDVSDAPIDLDSSDLTNVTITFTDKPASIAGVVHTTSGAPDQNAIVVGFPADPRGWIAPALHVFTTRASTTGSYSISAVAPGDYIVAAIPESLAASWKTYDVLQRIAPSAVRLKFDTGAHLTQDLTTTVVR